MTSDVHVPRSRLVRELNELGLSTGDTVMVHCRMSALGNVVGGAETVVRSLLDVLGPDGTLMAYTGWQDEPPEDLEELDEEIRRLYVEEHPVYDPRTSLARRDHGRVPESLRTWPGALHSGHPEAGIAAVGSSAGLIASGHPPDDAYGEGTPYARLVEDGGKVLSLGSPLETVTLIHHAEAIADVPGKRRITYGMPVMEGEPPERVWRAFHDIDTGEGALPYKDVIGDEVDYIEHIVRAALEDGVGRSGQIGESTSYLFEARELTEFAVGWIERNFGGKDSRDTA